MEVMMKLLMLAFVLLIAASYGYAGESSCYFLKWVRKRKWL